MTTFEEFFLVHIDVVRNTDIEAFVIVLMELATKYEEAMGRTLVRTVSDVTVAVGNVVDAEEQPFSWDHFLDALEKIEISFDEDGRHHVDIGINPETYKLLQRIKITPAQQQRYDGIITRKKEQWDAQKRARRLPRASQRAGV